MFVRIIFIVADIHLLGVCCQEKRTKPRSQRKGESHGQQRQAKPREEEAKEDGNQAIEQAASTART
jgi:hypothetical protein